MKDAFDQEMNEKTGASILKTLEEKMLDKKEEEVKEQAPEDPSKIIEVRKQLRSHYAGINDFTYLETSNMLCTVSNDCYINIFDLI